MSDAILATRLRAVAACDSTSFVELVKLSGLKPNRDFRHADLSYADLRGQDMSAFDLSHADLTGALLLGATFNATVTLQQRAAAINGARAVVIPIGEALLQDQDRLTTFFGDQVFVPAKVCKALRQLAQDPDRRLRRLGLYLGDGTDLARRRLSKPFRAIAPTLRASGACYILLEAKTDLDFDALRVIQGYLRRDGVKTIILALPTAEAAGQLAATRLRSLPAETWIGMEKPSSGRRVRLYSLPPQSLTHLQRMREKTAGLVWAVANSLPRVEDQVRRPGYSYALATSVVDGARRGTEPLDRAMVRDVAASSPGGDDVPSTGRRHLLVREDLFSNDVATRLNANLGDQYTPCSIATFPVRSGFDPEYYVISAPRDNDVWKTLG